MHAFIFSFLHQLIQQMWAEDRKVLEMGRRWSLRTKEACLVGACIGLVPYILRRLSLKQRFIKASGSFLRLLSAWEAM